MSIHSHLVVIFVRVERVLHEVRRAFFISLRVTSRRLGRLLHGSNPDTVQEVDHVAREHARRHICQPYLALEQLLVWRYQLTIDTEH